MVRSLRWLVLLSVFASSFGWAQSRASRRTRTRRPPPPASSVAKETARPAVDNRVCLSRRAVLRAEERKLDAERADLKAVEAELEQVRQRLRELQDTRVGLAKQVSATEVRLSQRRSDLSQGCAGSENCEQYEQMTTDLEARYKPVESQMTVVAKQISDTQRSVSDLRRKIDPLRREYSSKRCNALKAGETEQSTIDRCAAIFGEWNQLQADLNTYNGRLPLLRSRHGRLASQLQTTQEQAKTYETYLAKNCKRSPKLRTVQRFRRVSDRATRMHNELERLVKDVTSLRGIRITVE